MVPWSPAVRSLPPTRPTAAAAVTTACLIGSTRHSLLKQARLLRRALDIQGALKLGLPVGLDDIAADEFHALLGDSGGAE